MPLPNPGSKNCDLRSSLGTYPMKSILQKIWSQQDGVLSFEWILLVSLLTIGLISGISGARDAIIDELGDLAEAALCFDQSYTFAGIPALGIPASSYDDTKLTYTDCQRFYIP